MSDRPILLIHGSMHGAWCWRPAVAALAARGRRAIAIDLPGSGDDPTPPASVDLQSYVARIATELAAIGEPVTLVGHSLGGLASTIAAAHSDGRVAALIYVAAMVPLDGESAISRMMEMPSGGVAQKVKFTADGAASWIEAADAIDCFYHDCDPDAAADATRRLSRQPRAPIADVARVDGAIDAIPSGYILARDDRALPPGHQRLFAARRPNIRLVEIDGGHSPFLADPEAFADTLLALERAL